MNKPPHRLALAIIFYVAAKTFDFAASYLPSEGEYWALLYFGAAASCDWILFYVCRRLVGGSLCRDVEALCIASIFTNALGFALYMAPSPPIPYPDAYAWAIKGINYVLAFRLLFMGGGNVLDHRYWRDLVRSSFGGRAHFHTQKAK